VSKRAKDKSAGYRLSSTDVGAVSHFSPASREKVRNGGAVATTFISEIRDRLRILRSLFEHTGNAREYDLGGLERQASVATQTMEGFFR
jgi:hypothetical protein